MGFYEDDLEPSFNEGDCGGCKGHCDDHDCVCRILRKIARVQDATNNDGDCQYGCKQSIENLLSPTQNVSGNDTVPFILYCKGDCDPFIGQSVLQAMSGGNRVFQCFESPIFRVNKVKDNCCAEIELLLPVTMGGSTPGPGGDDVCDYFPGNSIRNLQRTGICITVDLKKFMGVACLEPVQTLPVSEFRARLRSNSTSAAE
ncbi:CotY/CotZ family spore coat protein [Allobacillus sp. GCM10007491]|uniref:Spore coat protein n=2 Tax=Allobacillus TaxID=1400133 RepID=A0A941HUB8_9BACI|nr:MULTISPECIES: CotY/CotZ family spore coat protein [Allobacillus]MBR7554725.1 spore coat protein [Allobacillus saliphilus]TSJ60699.1 spore coat protein [Allobacillus salarius]